MATVKKEARRIVEQILEVITSKGVRGEVHVRQKLEAGRRAVAEGNVVAHGEVEKRFLAR